MTTHIALLRGINVGGSKKILMSELKQILWGVGFQNIRTYIQSGNILLTIEDTDSLAISELIARMIFATYGFRVPVILRTVAEWEDILKNNPFLVEAKNGIDSLYVTLLSEEPKRETVDAVNVDSAPDEWVISGRTVYIHCSNSYGRTKLTNTFFEKKFGVSATTRNWKTMVVLLGMAKIP